MIKNSSQIKKVIAVLMLCAFVLPLAAFMDKPIASQAASKKPKLPRYEKCDDGIWRLKSIKTGKKDKSGKTDVKADETTSETVGTEETVRTNKITGEPVGKTTVVCMFVGDLMCLAGQQYDAGKKGKYDFSTSFAYVEPLFKSASLVSGNLETLVSGSNPLTRNQKNENDQPQCNGPAAYLTALKNAGFDMLVTANNHTCDWGPVGITETKTQIDKTGFANVGTHYNVSNKQDTGERYSIFEIDGIKIAVLSYTHLINQREKMTASEMNKMVHLYDEDTVTKDIVNARENGADFVAVYLHNGRENVEELTSTQIRDSKFVAEAGADLILGSHPHCLQPCTYIKTSYGRKVLCMYSLGNFVSSMERDINNDTIILRVEITKNVGRKNITVKMSKASYIPCKVMPWDGYQFVVMPANKNLNGGISKNALKESRERIGKVINGVIKEYVG